jgi:restriction system protein
MEQPSLPRIQDLLWPTLQAVRDLGGAAGIREINQRAMQIASLDEEQRSLPHAAGGAASEIEYRLRWARTNLKGVGALENPSHGQWAVTDLGRTMTEASLAPKARSRG